MNIHLLSGVSGAQQATGITVIIDVLRAASVAAYLLGKGVETITPVATATEAFAFKKVDPALILVGEDKGIKIEGFDLGNSPFEIQAQSDLLGKHAIHRSSTGTQGLVNSYHAQTIIFGSFVTTTAIKEYILKKQPQDVSLVSMEGYEDQLFAEYLKAQLVGEPYKSIEEITSMLEKHPECQWFMDDDNQHFPKEDFYLSLELDAFDFFPIVHNDKIVRSTGL